MDRYDAFLSFSFKDQDIVENVANELKDKYGISCWLCLDRISEGQSYKDKIPEAIDNSSAMVVFVSKDSIASTEVPKEVGMALKSDKTVIPFRLDDAKYQGRLRYDLEDVNFIDATKDPFEERIKDLAKAICFAASKPFETKDGFQPEMPVVTAEKENRKAIERTDSYKSAAEMQAEFSKVNVGDTIIFGAYEQDSEKWEHKEPLEWIVLAREKDKMLVITKYCIEGSDVFNDYEYERSMALYWLNNTFVNYAFNYEEKKMMKNSLFRNNKLFFLKSHEVEKYFISNEARVAKATVYAAARESGFIKGIDEFCEWFIASRTSFNRMDEVVNGIGEISSPSVTLMGGGYCAGIRPAMWIDLKSKF